MSETNDALTGLGNRIALMQALDGLGDDLSKALFALIDIDRFKAIHASLGDEGADQVLRQTARRLQSLKARLFRAGGDSFALLFDEAPREAKAAGDKAVEVCAPPHLVAGRSIFAPVSVGLARGQESDDPLALIKNAELALFAAKRQGGASALVYAPGLEEQEDGAGRRGDIGKRIAPGTGGRVSWRPTTSRSCAWPMDRWPVSRRCYVGVIHRAGWSSRVTSSLIPRRQV